MYIYESFIILPKSAHIHLFNIPKLTHGNFSDQNLSFVIIVIIVIVELFTFSTSL